jgi:uncharacterized membrane protein
LEPTSTHLTWDPIWPWPWAVAVAVALPFAVWFIARSLPRQSDEPVPSRMALIVRTLAALALSWLILRPSLTTTTKDENRVQIVVAVDSSRSMNVGDGAAGRTRWDRAASDLVEPSSLWSQLAEKVELQRWEFDQETRPLSPDRTSGTGNQTAIGELLDRLEQASRETRIAAVLLLSDGAQRTLPPLGLDPLTAARRLAEAQVPVYSIGYGSPTAVGGSFDAAVTELRLDPVVFEKKLVPVDVQLRTTGLAGRTVQVRLLQEDRTGKRLGESGELKPVPAGTNSQPMRQVTISDQQSTLPVALSFLPTTPGEVKVAVEVVPLDGELLTRNNRLETILTVRQGGLRVAYFDRGRAEQKFLRMVNGADNIQLDDFTLRVGPNAGRVSIPIELFQKDQYNVFIIGDLPVDVFPEAVLKALSARLEEGQGLLMTGGLQSFSAGGYQGSPLEEWLPVKLDPPGQPLGSGQLTDRIAMRPTATGRQRFVMQLASGGDTADQWLRLPPLKGATRLIPKNELVETWAEAPSGEALLLASEVGRARVAAFAGDTTFQWPLAGFATEHQRFWRQLILWLARKDTDTSQPVWVRVEPRNFPPGSTVSIDLGARMKADAPAGPVDFTVQVTGPDGVASSVTPQLAPPLSSTSANSTAGSSTSDSATSVVASAEFAGTLQPGDYWVRVSARQNGQALGFDTSTRFIIDPKDLELDRPEPDPDLLRRISDATGGQWLPPEDLPKLLERLVAMKFDDLERIQVFPLWDHSLVLLIFVGLMTAEWVLRKRAGLV